jgi:hypothetical protein
MNYTARNLCLWPVVLLLVFQGISVASESVVSTLSQTQINQFWEQQYSDIEQNCAHKQALGKAQAPGSSKSAILDTNALILDSDRDAADVMIRRTQCLLSDIKKRSPAPIVKELEKKLTALARQNTFNGLAKSATTGAVASRKDLFMQASALNREFVINDPLMNFDSLVFVTWKFPNCENHCVNSHFAYYAYFHAGIYLLTGIKSGNPVVVDFLKDATIQSSPASNRLKGRKVSGGAFLSPEVSFDGKTVLFAWSDSIDKTWHIMKVNRDGTNLVALTDGLSAQNFSPLMDSRKEDFDPCFLPNGRIVFISERRGGYGRCHTYEKPTFTLYSMKADGTDMFPLSYNETNEWEPSIANDGRLVYTRWDYVDRDDCIAHHMWTCYPDGTDPRSPHGNYPLPQTTMTGSGWTDGRFYRPNAEFQIRACPAPSAKYVATAGAHHSPIVGEIVIIDPNIADDGKMAQIKGVTTGITWWWDGLDDAHHNYATPWPLSEEVFLCGKGNDLIYRDKNGNEQVLYHDNNSWRPQDPIPLTTRKTPPVLPVKTWQGERSNLTDHLRATMTVMDVRVGDMALPAGATIKSMRIVQVIPQFNPVINTPRVGYSSESLVRLSLGIVPVESDGSVYCEAPVAKEIYFQLLNEKGLAVRTMRAGTFVHAGEQMSCVGCHEDKWQAVPPFSARIATQRPPSKLTPEIGTTVEPVGFYRTVKPVFDAKCSPCHTQQAKGPDMSYASLANYTFSWTGPGNPYVNGDIITPLHGGSRSLPNMYGAVYSKLTKYCDSTHSNVKLTAQELRRITLWMDLNSNELCAYNSATIPDQKAGKIVWPEIDIDTNNIQGTEKNFPAPGEVENRNCGSGFTDALPVSIGIRHHGSVIVVSNPTLRNISIALYDLNGRRVYQRELPRGLERYTIDVKNISLARGTYIVKAFSGNNFQKSSLAVYH